MNSCPSNFDNFIPNTNIPFWWEKDKEFNNITMFCIPALEPVQYYEEVDVPINQHTMYVIPYFFDNGQTVTYKQIKQRSQRVQF